MFSPSIHYVCLDTTDLLKDCEIRRGRSGGPGGQHRNKVETAVVITHTPTGISASADERRSQEENRKHAITRLRHKLAAEFRRSWTGSENVLDYKPSELWQQRSQSGKIVCNDRHHDFPLLIAEAMDMISAHHWEPKPAAAVLKVSVSQLLKLLHRDKAAWSNLQKNRQRLGLSPMRPPGR